MDMSEAGVILTVNSGQDELYNEAAGSFGPRSSAWRTRTKPTLISVAIQSHAGNLAGPASARCQNARSNKCASVRRNLKKVFWRNVREYVAGAISVVLLGFSIASLHNVLDRSAFALLIAAWRT
jgi:hypothetical protein